MSSQTQQAGEFLIGEALSKRVCSIAEGRRIRCAVAFWSSAGVHKLFSGKLPIDAKIICDISMGATSADALVALGAPHNRNLRHSEKMHAKVFISAKGLVVGSANASKSALGGEGGTIDNTEAGVFHLPGSPAWDAASAWFDKLLIDSTQIEDEQLEWARLVYRPKPPVLRPRGVTSGSLFDLVTAAPWRFSKVGFAFASTTASKAQKEEVRKEAEKSGDYDTDAIDQLKDDGTYYKWGRKEVRRWPEYFFSFWQPAERLSVYGCRVRVRVPKLGSLMTSRDWRGLRASCDIELPSASEIGNADLKMALKLRDDYGGTFFSDGFELAARIAEIRAAG